MKRLGFILLLLFLTSTLAFAQDPHRFDTEIQQFAKLSVPESKDLVVFTGSSSIRFWESVNDDCDQMQVINTGFGGSHMSDLLYFLDETVLRFQPGEVYIYEGDNDIADNKDPKAILETTKQIVNTILKSNSEIKIHFISPKPSPSRWNYKDRYIAFNSLLKEYCDGNDQLSYIDVWNPMLNDTGRPEPRIFISDSLHMNRQGYVLWTEIICGNSE